MDLKEKLDIIWKYSILLVIVISLIFMYTNHDYGCGYGRHGKCQHGQCYMDKHKDGKGVWNHDKHDMKDEKMMQKGDGE